MILCLESAGEHHRIWWLMIIIPIKMSVLEIPYIFSDKPIWNSCLLWMSFYWCHIHWRPWWDCKVRHRSTQFHLKLIWCICWKPQHNDIAYFFRSQHEKKTPSFHRQLSWMWGSLPNLWARLLLSGDKKRWKFQRIKGAKGSKFTCGVIPLERQATENTDFANFNENISCPWESIQQRMQGKAQDILDGSPIESSSKSEISVPTWSNWATKDIPIPSIPSGE